MRKGLIAAAVAVGIAAVAGVAAAALHRGKLWNC